MERSFFDQILYDSEMKLRDEARVALENITSMFDAERDFNEALVAVENFNLSIDRIEDLRIAIERYDVNEVIAVIGNEAYNNVCLEFIGEQVHIIYLKLKNFIDELIYRLMIWLRKVLLYFNGTAGKIEGMLKSYKDDNLKLNPDPSTDTVSAYSAVVFHNHLTALETLTKGHDEKTYAIITQTTATPAATLKTLDWTQALLIDYATKLLPLLTSRNELLKGVDELRKKQADLDKIEHDDATESAEKIKNLKDYRTEMVTAIKAINARIKTTTKLGKQLLAISKLSENLHKKKIPGLYGKIIAVM